MGDLRNALAKARDKWLESDQGKACLYGSATGKYLENRLICAFIAGADYATKQPAESLTEQLVAERVGKDNIYDPSNPRWDKYDAAATSHEYIAQVELDQAKKNLAARKEEAK